MSGADETINASVHIGDDAAVYGPVVGVNMGTINTIVQAAQVVTSLQQLRAPAADFVGRTHELNELLTALRPSADQHGPGSAVLCAICRMGGLGKTELALQAAHVVRDMHCWAWARPNSCWVIGKRRRRRIRKHWR